MNKKEFGILEDYGEIHLIVNFYDNFFDPGDFDIPVSSPVLCGHRKPWGSGGYSAWAAILDPEKGACSLEIVALPIKWHTMRVPCDDASWRLCWKIFHSENDILNWIHRLNGFRLPPQTPLCSWKPSLQTHWGTSSISLQTWLTEQVMSSHDSLTSAWRV